MPVYPPARVYETLTCWSFKKQADIATPQNSAAMWSLAKTDPTMASFQPVNETDASWIGKGHEFATRVFPSYNDTGLNIQKFLSSEIAAWASAFALGNVVVTGTGPYVYTITPIDPTTGVQELPYFSYVEQIRPGANVILDRLLKGCAINTVQFNAVKGPGLQSATCAIQCVGRGEQVSPSTITIPATTQEHPMRAASLAMTFLGFDYVANKNIESLTWGWNNNLDTSGGFFPGSGVDANGYAVRGRVEIGNRQPILSFQARLLKNSPEYAALLAQTTGTAVITLTYDVNNTCTWTYQKLAYSVVEVGTAGDKVAVNVTAAPLYDATNGILTVSATCPQTNICQ